MQQASGPPSRSSPTFPHAELRPHRASARKPSQSPCSHWVSRTTLITAEELSRLKPLGSEDERPMRNAGPDGAISPKNPTGKWGVPPCPLGTHLPLSGRIFQCRPDLWCHGQSRSSHGVPPLRAVCFLHSSQGMHSAQSPKTQFPFGWHKERN